MAVDLQTFYDEETRFLDEGGSRLVAGVDEDSYDTLDLASLYRHIPNSIGWPTERQGYSLTHKSDGNPYLLRDDQVVGVWDAGRWFSREEAKAASAAMIELWPLQLRSLIEAVAGVST